MISKKLKLLKDWLISSDDVILLGSTNYDKIIKNEEIPLELHFIYTPTYKKIVNEILKQHDLYGH